MELETKKVIENKEKTNEENIETKKDLSNTVQSGLIVDIGKKQNKFLESTLGKVINTGIDVALRAILPNAIENEVIGIKNIIINDGFKEGIKSAVNAASNIGKSISGIFTGKFDSVSQAYTAVRSGGIIDTASKMVDTAIKSAEENNLIQNSTAKLIKKSKNVVKDCISSNFMEQVDGIEKVGKYINNWNNYLEKKDLAGMKREYNKITKKLGELIPLESTLKTARAIENVQILIKNKGNSLENITEEEIKLAQTL